MLKSVEFAILNMPWLFRMRVYHTVASSCKDCFLFYNVFGIS